MGWYVHRLTKYKLCQSNETLHALNSTFPHTYWIVSFQINPHWVSTLGLWKVVLETFHERLGKLVEGVLYHQDSARAHNSVVAIAAVCDWLWTDWSPSNILLFDPIWLFSVSQHQNKHLAGKYYWTNDEVISAGEDFFWGSGWELLYHGNPSAATLTEEMCGLKGRLSSAARQKGLSSCVHQKHAFRDNCICSVWMPLKNRILNVTGWKFTVL